MHRELSFVADRYGFYLQFLLELIVEKGESEKRSGADHIGASVNGERLDGGASPWAILDFVEKDGGVSGDELEIREPDAEFLEKIIRFNAVRKYLAIFRIVNEVDVQVTRVVVSCKTIDYERLADLTSTFDEESFLAVGLLPFEQRVVEFSFEHGTVWVS